MTTQNLLILLMTFPAVIGVGLLLIRGENLRKWVVLAAALIIGLASLALVQGSPQQSAVYFPAQSLLFNKAVFAMEMLIAVYLLGLGLRARRPWVFLLVAAQVGVSLYMEFLAHHPHETTFNLFLDPFSILMAVIIGVIGSAIGVFSLGYMKDFHEHHHEIADRRPFFFFVLFVFLAAMFGIVFSNNLMWLYFFWEITTLASFLMIGYTRTEEATRNAFLALQINLLGGVAFIAGIAYLSATMGTIELDKVLLAGKGAVMIPVVLMGIAALTKSAQMPFSSWLLGAMVAPTPVSALLHSSTMVKAGVYLILRFSGLLEGTSAGFFFALIGGITFLIPSFIAVTQNNAKKVLAYSTIANLGLVVLCAGIGTYEAVWAGIFLILFHAVAKGLLFLCVGVVEHQIGSREIEDMEGLIIRMPKIAVMMLIGMAGMFLAPFGMLISKWAALKALVDANAILAVIVVFGSAATLFFWVKWMGKLIMVISPKTDHIEKTSRVEFAPLAVLAWLTVLVCVLFPWISSFLIEPYVLRIYGASMNLGKGNIIAMLIMLGLVLLFPFMSSAFGRNARRVSPYLGGGNTEERGSFYNSLGQAQAMAMKNYVLNDLFEERDLFRLAVGITIFLIAIVMGITLL